MDLSVIIVNYNVRQFLENALASLYRAMEGIDGEIFVVDNASDDGSVEMVREKFPDVRLIENRANLGFARANNIALNLSQGSHLLLINPDTVVQEDTLRVMLQFFVSHPDAGLAGCKILNPDGTFQLPCRRSFPTPWVAFTKIMGLGALFPGSRLFGKYNLTYLSEDETYNVDAVSGSFMMVSRKAYEKVGGLDETFFMYGEDLDWCYRIAQSGFQVYYVHSTKIIHFKGESTRRSDIDEIRTFYHAMQLFVEKHFSRSAVVEIFLTIGIMLRAGLALMAKGSRTFFLAGMDFVLVDLTLLLGEFLYFGEIMHFRKDSYPVVFTVPALIVVLSLYTSGLYTNNRHSVSRAGVGVILSFVIISALVFFAKDFAFSRAVVLISGVLSLLLIPGWRLAFRLAGRGAARSGHRSLFGRPTLIVGTGSFAREVLRKLRERVDGGYDVLGFIDINRKRVGERIAGVEIVGSIDNIGKVIDQRKVSEVLFSTEGMSYTDILSVIARSNSKGVNFRLVPNSLEAIIGKTLIDPLDAMPFVDIEYNIRRPVNRFTKRLFDILLSTVLLVSVYPIARVWRWVGGKQRSGSLMQSIDLLPRVLRGNMSFVGLPVEAKASSGDPAAGRSARELYMGPFGLTGLVQINRREGLERDEMEKYKLYYAKNQSMALDVEILLKALLLRIRK